MKDLKISIIIHFFAVLHAAVSLCCRWAGIEDELLLTILTMTMVLLICRKRGLTIELTAASIIMANILGYLLGNAGARLFALIFESQYPIHSLATALTTELLGWSIMLFSRIFRKGTKRNDQTSSYITWLILAMGVIFFLRLAFMLILSDSGTPEEDTVSITSLILSNTFSLILLICVNILFVWSTRRALKNKTSGIKFLYLSLFTLIVSVIETVLVFYGQADESNINSAQEFARLFLGSMIAQITIYCLVYMVNYAITAQNKMLKERGKANEAQYRYQILKRQVNPHFLFNSLNALDCLVCEEKTEQASTYIHKLAGVYRYMIKSEEEQLVPLEEELKFVEKYVDLMLVRFPDGLHVNIDIPAELMSRFILPCSLQLLIENATKHNVINAANPLVIQICSNGESISVTNNIIPKVTKASSTGLGQKYIRQQYQNLCGKEIAISQSELEYKVILPLI
jgi:LytS/YehU family sensor histidine kinase